MGQNFGSVLAIAVKQHDDVESFVHEVLVAGLLIAAVAQVFFVVDHMQLGKVAHHLHAGRQLISRVLAGIVEYRDFFHVLPDVGRDSFEDFRQRGYRIKRHDEDADPLALALGQLRLVLHQTAVEGWQGLEGQGDCCTLTGYSIRHTTIDAYISIARKGRSRGDHQPLN